MKTILLLLFCLLVLGCSSGSSDSESPAPIDGPTTKNDSIDCSGAVLAKGSRQFGMDILYEPVSGVYTTSLNTLVSIGGEFQTYHVNWNSIEGSGSGTSSGAFSSTATAYLVALNAAAESTKTKVVLRIHPVDLTGEFVPADLLGQRFFVDYPYTAQKTMAIRFKKMLDFVFTKISPSNVARLLIGNEIDGYTPATGANFWIDYPQFLIEVKSHMDSQTPLSNIEVGFVITAKGATDRSKRISSFGNTVAQDIFLSWANYVDFVGITYYPLSSDYSMESNSTVAGVFSALNTFSNKPLHIEEVGYSTSSTVKGSEQLQADFYCEIFKSWDAYSAKIPTIAALRMSDTTLPTAQQTAIDYGLGGNSNFIEYIRTLGLRTETNQDKKALKVIANELKRRGF